MDKDNKLITEAYLEESNTRSFALAILCALGINMTGCKLTNVSMPPEWYKQIDTVPKMNLSPEDIERLKSDILKDVDLNNRDQHDIQYWTNWADEWKKNNDVN